MRNAPRSAEDLPVNDATSQPPEEFLLKLNIHTTPSPADPAGADEFYKAFGIMMIAWGRLENHLTTCLLTLAAAGHRMPFSRPLSGPPTSSAVAHQVEDIVKRWNSSARWRRLRKIAMLLLTRSGTSSIHRSRSPLAQ